MIPEGQEELTKRIGDLESQLELQQEGRENMLKILQEQANTLRILERVIFRMSSNIEVMYSHQFPKAPQNKDLDYAPIIIK